MTLEELKEDKRKENSIKARSCRYNKEFLVKINNKDCLFDTGVETQIDLITAYIVCLQCGIYEKWITNNSIEINLTIDDIVAIAKEFQKNSDIYQLWQHYEKLIDEATTAAELNAIQIDFGG